MATPAPHDGDRMLNRSMLIKLVVMAAVMFGFGFALVPLYRAICNITGANSLVKRDVTAAGARNTQVDTTRTVSVEFDANARGALVFSPEQNAFDVHPGAVTAVKYRVTNSLNRTVHAQAIPSYAPAVAGQYFEKIECFCFTQQTLAPHETREMPVVFFVDPKLPRDVRTITLSYTFFELGGPAGETTSAGQGGTAAATPAGGA
ncbi:cytochrome c oxidase assembly protein [Trinickia dabaoshanensis]|uniref:Cytochrome c oxidase assembly protein CtaG n=1 Tax=Trinickia dabaoshanensis TaxID=564714 RepID=A0A2N7VVV7_9BURK|nr:cytochrome c oxidase assembly protein [Trinickia dabaoshanensis]PMS21282.1 cytochrome c oxidase assembly protein [Trinickia dabaoshanensis]